LFFKIIWGGQLQKINKLRAQVGLHVVPDKTGQVGWSGLIGLVMPDLCSFFLFFFN